MEERNRSRKGFFFERVVEGAGAQGGQRPALCTIAQEPNFLAQQSELVVTGHWSLVTGHAACFCQEFQHWRNNISKRSSAGIYTKLTHGPMCYMIPRLLELNSCAEDICMIPYAG